MTERPSAARVSVKERLGPLPPEAPSSKRNRERSADRSLRRGRKASKSAGRVSVHERLGPLPPQATVQKRSRPQVWRHPGAASQEPEAGVESGESVKASSVKFAKAPSAPPPAFPVVQPFDAEKHRQTWTWTRPTSESAAMEVDESR